MKAAWYMWFTSSAGGGGDHCPYLHRGAALFLGQGLYYLAVDPLLDSSQVSFPGMLLCVVGLCLLGYWGAAMLMRKSFRVLRATWKGALAAAAVTAALCLCVRADILGVEDYIPPLEQVKSVTFDISGYGNYYYGNLEDAPEIERFWLCRRPSLRRRTICGKAPAAPCPWTTLPLGAKWRRTSPCRPT